jgi:aspartate racemase
MGTTEPQHREAVVGVLGGMGPAATVDLLRRLIDLTPARDDADHLRVLVDNNPKVPSRVAALIDGTGPSPAPVLVAMARGLEAQGADFLVMPCNTAHHYHAEVAASVGIPFLSLPELVREALDAMEPRPRRVGLLASSALPRIGLYEASLGTCEREVVYPQPSLQTALMALIGAVKAEGVAAVDAEPLRVAAADLIGAGADVLLVACTELSALGDALAGTLDVPVVDAADVLARATVSHARRGVTGAG